MADKTYYITTPIYYVNDKPHLGHAYTTVACDVMARFKRLDGFDVFFLTGTDEHGQKVAQAAEAAGIDPQAFTDKVSQNFRDLGPVMNYSNDDFIRTTEPRHKKAAQALWEKLVAAGDIYKDKYGGWYAVRDEAYYGEDELQTVNGKKIAPSGAECEWVEEESYFFKLSAWGDKLLEFYAKNPDCILPESRKNEVTSFVKGGLKDLSVSRSRLSWGIPVPGDDKHVMYVWIDALTNYLTAVGYPDENSENFRKFWPSAIHIVGKDILRFHAVYWPAFLMAAGLQPPQRVFAHGWWTIEGQKMSKSLGNVISPYDLVDRYGVDQARFFMLREVPFGNDGNFSHESAVNRLNSDLANSIGNLSQRSLSMINKNCDARIPDAGALTDDDKALLNNVHNHLFDTLRGHIDRQQLHLYVDAIVAASDKANVYIDKEAPWKLKKTDPARMETVLYVLAETVRCIALALQPVTPASAAKMLDQLAISESQRSFAYATAQHKLKPGTELPAPEGVFPRIMAEEALAANG